MPNFIMLYNNVVANVIVGESLDYIQSLFPTMDVIEQTLENEKVSIGWTYDGSEFHPPVEQDESL